MEGDDNKNCSCAAILNRIKDIEEEIEHLKKAPKGGGGRAKRAPSAYNLFIKECVPKKSGPITDRFRACVEEYKKEKF